MVVLKFCANHDKKSHGQNRTTWWISLDENNVQKILMGLQKVVHNDYGFGLKLLGCRGVMSMH